MHLPHIPKCSIQNRNMHIFVFSGALWDMGQVHRQWTSVHSDCVLCVLPTLSAPFWRHQMETFSVLLALCEGNPPFTCGIPSQRPVAGSFGVFFFICARIIGGKDIRDAGDLRRNCNVADCEIDSPTWSTHPAARPLTYGDMHSWKYGVSMAIKRPRTIYAYLTWINKLQVPVIFVTRPIWIQGPVFINMY